MFPVSACARSLMNDYAATVLEHGSEKHKQLTLQHLLDGLLEFATNEQGAKSVTKALKEGGKATLDKIVERMCEPAKGYKPSSFDSFPLVWGIDRFGLGPEGQ